MGDKKKFVFGGIIALVVLVIAGAEGFARNYAFRGSLIDPPFSAPDITLNDQNGQPFRLSDQRGRIVLIFFGYTHCPDICPTTLAQFKQARTQLGSQADQVRFVFITVDPQRDTAERMKTYLAALDPTIIGLSGSEADLTPVWSHYGVYRQKQAGPTPDDYSMDHSTQVYLVDKQGNLRLTYAYGTPTDNMVQDIRYLLAHK